MPSSRVVLCSVGETASQSKSVTLALPVVITSSLLSTRSSRYSSRKVLRTNCDTVRTTTFHLPSSPVPRRNLTQRNRDTESKRAQRGAFRSVILRRRLRYYAAERGGGCFRFRFCFCPCRTCRTCRSCCRIVNSLRQYSPILPKLTVPHRNITARNGWLWGDGTDWERRHLGGGTVGRAVPASRPPLGQRASCPLTPTALRTTRPNPKSSPTSSSSTPKR